MKFKLYISSLFVYVFCCVSLQAYSQSVGNQIDHIFSDWNKDVPGGAVAVIDHGKVVFSNGYGSADLEHNVSITPSSVFYIGSTGKQFAAFCILLLEEQGKLKLDDDIRSYLPDFPFYGSPITIHHLLHHTSGIRDFSTLWELQGRSYFDLFTAAETYELIKRQRALNFVPGEEYLYSNSGYFLLGEIVKKVTGIPLRQFAYREIFEPLGMTNTLYLDDSKDLISNRVFGYYLSADGKQFKNAIRRYELVGAGGVYSTVPDLARWDHNFYDNKLGKGGPAIIEKMYAEGMVNDDRPTGYASGLIISSYKGLRKISHGGSHGGFKAQIMRFPTVELSVIVLSNRSDTRIDTRAQAVAGLFPAIAGSMADPLVPVRVGRQISAGELNKLPGTYIDQWSGNTALIIRRGDSLFYQLKDGKEIRLVPTSRNELTFDDGSSNRIVVEKAEMPRYSIFRKAERINLFIKSAISKVPLTALKGIAGKYYCSDLNVTYEFRVAGDSLNLFINQNFISTLKPSGNNMFAGKGLGTFTFRTDKTGTVTACGFQSATTRHMDFKIII